MPGFLFHVGASATCPHGGQVSTISSNVRVKVSGQLVATSSDLCMVAGCAFAVSSKPQPCIQVKWAGATKVKVNGQAALLQTGQELCESAEGIKQGPPIVSMSQKRVRGT